MRRDAHAPCTSLPWMLPDLAQVQSHVPRPRPQPGPNATLLPAEVEQWQSEPVNRRQYGHSAEKQNQTSKQSQINGPPGEGVDS
jgi:hypothetical protein